MKIRKTDIPGLDTKAKIENALKTHADELEYRANVGNKAFTQPRKIIELHFHTQNGGAWEYTAKTLEQEQEQEKLEAEEKLEKEKQDRIILAKTDGDVRDLLIMELMNEAGFTSDKVVFSLVQETKDKKEIDQFWLDRESKLAEIKQMIADA